MAGTIVVDRIESDASYASNINVASQITFSNTVNFGITSVAPVAGFYSPSTNNVAFTTASTERMRINPSGNVGIGTASPGNRLSVSGVAGISGASGGGAAIPSTQHTSSSALRLGLRGSVMACDDVALSEVGTYFSDNVFFRNASGNPGYIVTAAATQIMMEAGKTIFRRAASGTSDTDISFTESMRIDSSGNLLVGKTSPNSLGTAGFEIQPSGYMALVRSGNIPFTINRLVDDGVLVQFFQASTEEGTISVSGTTVSYNGGHLSRWAQMLTKPDLLKGTVMSNLDAMNVYTDADGNPVENEQLNKVKVSDVEGDANVAGVFVNWTYDEAHQVDEINMAMTGDMIIRIAQGVTVQRGDLLMSAGDGTAKAQGDDIVRSKTIAKVTSNHVTCTYADGSYCVPCVLMAC